MNTLNVRSSLKGVGRAKDFLKAFCRDNAVPDEATGKFCVAADEFLSNIVPAVTTPRIRLGVEMRTMDDRNSLVFTVVHGGPRYDISDERRIVWPSDATGTKFSELTAHRLHGYLDGIECAYAGGENLVTLVKNL